MYDRNNLFYCLLIKQGIQGEGCNSRRLSCSTLFCIKGFNFNKFFQISHDCETKNERHSQTYLVKLVSKNYYIYLFLIIRGLRSREGRGET